MKPRVPPRVFLIAGEPSGDAIGARLMAALRREHREPVQFVGVGGPRMSAAGLHSIFPMADLSVMGFTELLPALPRLAMRLRQTINAVRAEAPALVVGIDSKAFCLRVLGAISAERRRGGTLDPAPALVQYVGPSAWAFANAPERAARLNQVVDELLVLLPFEPALFEGAGLRCTFVGHPAVDRADVVEPESDKIVDGWADTSRGGTLCLLPGSRPQEVHSNLPVMLAAAESIAGSYVPHSDQHRDGITLTAASRSTGMRAPGAISRLLLPAPPSVRTLVEEYVHARPHGSLPAVVASDGTRHAAYAASCLALACSGTVNVELAAAGTPQVALYRSSRLTSLIVRHVLRPTIRHATLPNLLNTHPAYHSLHPPAGASQRHGLIPELLFEEATAEAVAEAALRLLHDPAKMEAQVAASARALESLSVKDAAGRAVPSATVAARALLRHLA